MSTVRPTPPATRTEPTRRLCPPPGQPAHRYVPAAATDIRETFRRVAQENRNA